LSAPASYKKILTALHLRRLGLIPSRFHVAAWRRLDANIDVFRKAVDDLKALRE
jgi:hypothetical protein